jgi:hypothetical protein
MWTFEAMKVERSELAHGMSGGMVAGFIGGLFLALCMVTMRAAAGQDLWPAFKGASAPFFGARAAHAGFDAGPVLLGILCHFAIAIGWGALFGLVIYGASRGATVLAGVPLGIAVWLWMYYVLLPLVGLGGVVRAVPIGFAIFTHVVFGLVVAIAYLPFQHRRVERWPPLRHARSGA